jgi:succinate-semialdehyde dehydrogenase/glutarate-semialdehyde dehydrogenase
MSEVLTSRNPATGETVTEVPVDGPQAVEAALADARQAQAEWADRSLEDRLAALATATDRIVDERMALAEAITTEAGKPVPEALVADLMTTLEAGRFLDRHAGDVLEPPAERLDNLLLKDRKSQRRRDPAGVVGIIAPWNYPLAIPATQALFALAAGNGIVIKPSERTPGVGSRLVDILQTADVPQGLVGLVQGPGDPTGQALVEAGPDVLLFTGSVETGQAIRGAADPRTDVVLELGGNDPMLVLDDANLSLAAQGATWAAFTNAGQTCSAVERLYADGAVYDELVDRLAKQAEALRVGPGDEDVDVGPLIVEQAAERAMAHVTDALDRGARLVAGGERREQLGPRFVEPTVIADVPPEARVMNEETFGPILPVASVADEEEALERANDSDYGLTASVWTTRADRGDELARRLEAGTVTVNDHAYTYAACETPWGGLKASGQGHTHGRAGLEAVTELKHVNHAPAGRRTSPWWFPYDEDLRRVGDEGLAFLYGRASKLEALGSAAPLIRRLLGP